MLLERKIYNKLRELKNKYNGTRSILIEGPLCVGKTTLVTKFANEEYKSYILIDFSNITKTIKDNFDNNLINLDTFFQIIQLEYGKQLYKRESLIIFDEIQKFPKAREALKYLVKDGRYDFISTGSLISIKENVNDIIIPSEEIKIKMYPLDFEEFLMASGEELLIEYIKDCFNKKIPLDDKFHNKAMWLFREYILVGGMPQAVNAYLENNKNFQKADDVKRQILSLYREDINKASKRYNSKVNALFENIPGFLSTHEKKVVLREIDKNKVFSQYDEPLFWLDDSMICNLCYRCNNPTVGLALNKDETFVKCYMGDTGLLVSLAFSENEIADNELYKEIMFGKLSLNEGMLYENVIAQMLASKGIKLYFYTHFSNELHRNDMEIDFLVSNQSKTNYKVWPIEVKSSKNFTTISYDKFKSKFKERISESIIISPKQFSVKDGNLNIPPYMLICLFNY